MHTLDIRLTDEKGDIIYQTGINWDNNVFPIKTSFVKRSVSIMMAHIDKYDAPSLNENRNPNIQDAQTAIKDTETKKEVSSVHENRSPSPTMPTKRKLVV